MQLGILKKVFLALSEWWYLVPDQSILTTGGQTQGQILNLAARHKDSKWVMAYLGSRASFWINVNRIVAAKVDAHWIDPKTGNSTGAGSFLNAGTQPFSTPAGWEDTILILESSGS